MSKPQGWKSNGASIPMSSSAAHPRRAAPRPPPRRGGEQAAAARRLPAVPGESPTAQDYIDIRALASQHAYGLDSGAENGTECLRECPAETRTYGLLATSAGRRQCGGTGRVTGSCCPRSRDLTCGIMTNHLIEASPSARGKVYLVIDIAFQERLTREHGRALRDVYVRRRRWRIKSGNFYRSKPAQRSRPAAAGHRPR